MAKIQDKSKAYFALKVYTDRMFKWAYRRVEYHGKENIPQDGAIIYAANHTNTLMDALAVLAIDKEAKVFVARADMFKQPTILKFLTFLKMLPINRIRDGRDSLVQNEEINDIVVDALQDKVPFCIMPEATHRTMHSLMPLRKGIFRIALQANEAFGDKMPLYIVPVGIEFGHFFKYRSSLLLQIGEPVNVTQFLREHPEMEHPQQQMSGLRAELSEKMKKLILHIPDDANYQATMELTQLYGNEQRRRLRLRGDFLINKFTAAQKNIENTATLLESKPQETKELLDLAGEFSRQRHASGIEMKSVLRPHVRWAFIGKIVFLLLGLPYFIFSAVVTSPVTLLFERLSTKFADKAFYNTLRFLISLALLPILLLLMGTIAAIFFPWKWALAFVLLFLPSFFFFHDYLRLMRWMISDMKWIINRDLQKQFKKIKDLKTSLLN